MIAKSDKRRIWAAEHGRGYFSTPVHTPNLAGALGLILVAVLGLGLWVVVPDVMAGAGVLIAAPPVALSVSGNDNVELVEARGKLDEKSARLAKVFEEAKTTDGKVDFRLVKVLGEGKTSSDVRDEVNKLNDECAVLWKECLALAKTQDGSELLKRMEEGRSIHPPPGDDPDDASNAAKQFRTKGAGKMVLESEQFKEFRKGGSKGGVDVTLDVLPSDVLGGAGFKTLMTTSTGWAPQAIRLPGFVDDVTRPIQLLDIIPFARTSESAIAYMEETTRTHAAAEATEGAAYAESTFAFTAQSVTIRKIADSLPVTDEQIEDVDQMESYINNRLMFGVRQRLDIQVLVGNGIPPNIEGILNVTGIQTQALGTDNIPDAFFKAGTLVRVTGRAVPTHNVMHSTDWEKVRLLTTADGIYIWGPPSQGGPETLWGRPVVQTEAGSAAVPVMSAPSFLSGSLCSRSAGSTSRSVTPGHSSPKASGRSGLT